MPDPGHLGHQNGQATGGKAALAAPSMASGSWPRSTGVGRKGDAVAHPGTNSASTQEGQGLIQFRLSAEPL